MHQIYPNMTSFSAFLGSISVPFLGSLQPRLQQPDDRYETPMALGAPAASRRSRQLGPGGVQRGAQRL